MPLALISSFVGKENLLAISLSNNKENLLKEIPKNYVKYLFKTLDPKYNREYFVPKGFNKDTFLDNELYFTIEQLNNLRIVA